MAGVETTYDVYLNAVVGLSEPTGSELTFAELEANYKIANEFNKEHGWPLEKPDYEALPDKLVVNALDVFFEAILSDISMVVRIDPTRVGNVQQLYMFLRTQMTPGATPIILALPPPVDGELLDNDDGTTLVDGPPVFYPWGYLCVTETVLVNNMTAGPSITFYPERSVLNLN